MTVKPAGMALPEPTKTTPENWMASCIITGYLVAALRIQEEFRKTDHATYMREGREYVRKRNTLQLEEELTDALEGAPVHVTHRLRRATTTGELLTV